jgi:hypothetical protein
MDEVSGETWTWDGDRWTQAEDVGPGPRANHVMAYDSVRDVVVLFGGSHPDGSLYRDTWTWDGERWTQVQDIGPMGTAHAAFTFAGSIAVLFGGLSGEAQVPSGTTWSWDGDFWTQEQDIGPRPRWGHAMAYDGEREDGEGDIVLFGGVTGRADDITAAALRGDTWTLPPKGAPGRPTPRPHPDSEIEGMTVSPEVVPRGGNVTLTVRLRRVLEQPTLVTVTVAEQFFADLVFPPMVPLMQRQVVVNLPFGEYELEARVRQEDQPVTARMVVTL